MFESFANSFNCLPQHLHTKKQSSSNVKSECSHDIFFYIYNKKDFGLSIKMDH